MTENASVEGKVPDATELGEGHVPRYMARPDGARRRRRRRLLLVLLVPLVFVAPIASALLIQPPEPVGVRLGYFPNMTHSQALVGLQLGMFTDHLASDMWLKTYIFNAGPSAIEALYAGKLDMTYIGPSPTITGFVNSKGEALRCIAGANSGGAVFVIRDGSGISAAQDLAGKKVASPQIGNTQDVALRHYLKLNGLKTKDDGGNVEVVSVPNADILTLFKKGELDAAWVPEPWGARLVNEAKGRILIDERTTWPNGAFVTTNIIVSTKFLREHPEAVRAILEAHVEATLWINENPEVAKAVINDRLLNLTGKALTDKVLSESFSRMNVTYDPVRSSLYAYADWAYDLGLLGTEKPNLGSLYDLGPLNSVLAEKGLAPVA